jgi:predicted SnoaL-like aldol condensation-catalyzing enzyme
MNDKEHSFLHPYMDSMPDTFQKEKGKAVLFVIHQAIQEPAIRLTGFTNNWNSPAATAMEHWQSTLAVF